MSHPAVITVSLNPAIDQTVIIPGFAAGKVNRVAESRCDAGGKGVNVAGVLSDLGLGVAVTGFLGLENAGVFEAFFARKGVTDLMTRIAGSTRVGIKIVDDLARETTDINFPGLTPSTKELKLLMTQVEMLAEPGRWFVLSGSVPAGAPEDIYAHIIDAVHQAGAHVMLDTSGRPLRKALASKPEIIKPNADELGELVGREVTTYEDVRVAATSLLESGVELVAVSMGAQGAVFVDSTQALVAHPPQVKVRSTVGAGDAMVAGIVFARLSGLPLDTIARIGTAAGACAVTKVGAGMEDLHEHRRMEEQVRIEVLTHAGEHGGLPQSLSEG